MLEKVIEILTHYTEKPVGEIKEQSQLTNDLGLSSFDVVNAVVEFEDAFKIEICDDNISELKTVKDIVTYIENKIIC